MWTIFLESSSVYICVQLRVYERVLALPEYELLKSSVEPCTCPASGGRLTRRQCCLKDRSAEMAADILKAISQVRGCLIDTCLSASHTLLAVKLRKIANHLYRLVDVDVEDGGPFCRKALGGDTDTVKRLHLEHSLELSGKLAVLAQLLPEWYVWGERRAMFDYLSLMHIYSRRRQRNDKVLLFSQSTKMLQIIARYVSLRSLWIVVLTV